MSRRTPLAFLLDLKPKPARTERRAACTMHTDVACNGSALAKPVMGLFEPLVHVEPLTVRTRRLREGNSRTACSIDLAPT